MIRFSLGVLFLLVQATGADVVYERAPASARTCRIESWSMDGLRISVGTEDKQQVIPWHRIKSVESDMVGIGLVEHLKRGTMLWRAKIRLLRGDLELAKPLFREVFLALKNSDGVDSFLAAEGLLRCELAQGNANNAVAPWLVCIRHLQHGASSPFTSLASVFDAETLLCKHLPPVWDQEAIEKDTRTLKIQGDLMQAFFDAAHQRDRESQPFLGPKLLQQFFILRNPSHPNYEKVKNALIQIEEDHWLSAWNLYAEAQGLLSGGQQILEEGQLKLVELIALYGEEQPLLGGFALHALIETTQSTGQQSLSQNLLREFEKTYPNHPLLQGKRSH
ncbi:MAG: hypothetical protein QGI78_07645 [Phycisphaerales bacterium]|jgi:hypothetical protein|nr:hypothetical protein [Phycisphaerales bacterium]